MRTLLFINTVTSAGQLFAAWGIYRGRFYTMLDYTAARHELVLQTATHMTRLLRRARPFAVAAVLSAIQLRLSVILLEQMRGAAETGQYAAASRFVDAGRLLPNALFGALFPALAALSRDPQVLRQLFRRMQLLLAGYGLLIGLGAVIFSTELIRLTYGPDFAAASPILSLLAWALLPGVLKGIRIIYCYAQGREALVNRVLALALIVQVALSLWLIPVYGPFGAALALIVSDSLALIGLWR